MSVARKWVFPILGLVIAAAIAVALVKLAFFGTSAAGAGGEEPTGGFVDPQVPVMISTVSNDVVLSGTVKADDAVPVKAPLDGTLASVDVGVGSVVGAGQQIGVVKGVNSSGRAITVAITAPVAGTISALSIVANQSTTAGTTVAQIAPPGFYITAPVQPADRYRLVAAPTEGTVTVTGGPAPFTCTNLTVTTPLAGAGTGEDPGTGDPGAGSGTTARCVVPADVTVFPDLVAQLTISAGVAENVLVVPVTAVLGAAESGVVYVVDPETGETQERPVTLGLSDGINVEVVDGLEEGELVMQFVPGAPADPGMPTDGGIIIGYGG
ncbi:efflux RND transporter periplasmic adaptor subunit [Pseudolysinimonas sp.]|jgi:macrolide-specific efflux system membrane fusion protein|uniref:efflux RND transporter periplasmic adaptor subunit n=1 Tax=Pseudolysinimonas sp. TaxID=2680009 RepID=UPI0037842466